MASGMTPALGYLFLCCVIFATKKMVTSPCLSIKLTQWTESLLGGQQPPMPFWYITLGTSNTMSQTHIALVLIVSRAQSTPILSTTTVSSVSYSATLILKLKSPILLEHVLSMWIRHPDVFSQAQLWIFPFHLLPLTLHQVCVTLFYLTTEHWIASVYWTWQISSRGLLLPTPPPTLKPTLFSAVPPAQFKNHIQA